MDAVQPPTDRLITGNFVKLGVMDLAYFTAMGLSIYTLPLYVVGPIKAGNAGAGLAVGAFSITALVLRPIAGRLSDLHGRRPLLVGGAVLCAAATAGLAFVDDLGPVVALRLVVGIGEAAFFVAGFAALADLAPPSRTGEALSYNSLALFLGMAVGPILGHALVARGGYDLSFYGGGALCLLAALVALSIPETADRSATNPAAPRSELVHRPSIAPSIGLFAGVTGAGAFLAFAALRARDVGVANPSWVLFEYGIVVVCCRIVFAKVADNMPPFRLGAFALCTTAVGLVACASTSAATALFIGTALIALGVALMTPAFFAAIFSRAEPHERGAASATTSIFLDLGVGGGPIILGALAGASGIPAAFAGGAAIAVGGAVWTYYLGRSARAAV